MTEETLPEIQAATQALERLIAQYETQVAEMKEGIASKKKDIRRWRKAILTVGLKPATVERRRR